MKLRELTLDGIRQKISVISIEGDWVMEDTVIEIEIERLVNLDGVIEWNVYVYTEQGEKAEFYTSTAEEAFDIARQFRVDKVKFSKVNFFSPSLPF